MTIQNETSVEEIASLPEGEVSIAGIDKAKLLVALYNGSAPMGMGWLQARPGEMTLEKAQAAIEHGDDSDRMFPGQRRKERLYFDYLFGRPLKIDLTGDVLRTWGYNRDNGKGAAEELVAQLRKEVTSG